MMITHFFKVLSVLMTLQGILLFMAHVLGT